MNAVSPAHAWTQGPKRGDSSAVVVDYRVRNTGNTIVRNYEAYFRIVTPRGDFFQEVQRTALAAGQTDIGRFEKDAGGALATSVRVDGFFIDGQTRPAARGAARAAGRQPIQPSR